MTTFNWDRVNMEDLEARRGYEYIRFPSDVLSYSQRPARKRLLAPHQTVCPKCSSVVNQSNLGKHLSNVHSAKKKAKKKAKTPQKRPRKSVVMTAPSIALGSLVESIQAIPPSPAELGRARVDIIYWAQNVKLAKKVLIYVQSLGFSVRLIQTTRAYKPQKTFRTIRCNVISSQAKAIAESVSAKLHGLIETQVEYLNSTNRAEIVLTIWI